MSFAQIPGSICPNQKAICALYTYKDIVSTEYRGVCVSSHYMLQHCHKQVSWLMRPFYCGIKVKSDRSALLSLPELIDIQPDGAWAKEEVVQ